MISLHPISYFAYARTPSPASLSVFCTCQSVLESIQDGIPDSIRELLCCALCGCPTPWNDGGSFDCADQWSLIRTARPLGLFSAPLTGAEFYRRVGDLVNHSDLMGIWCPDCAASRIISCNVGSWPVR
jgi:hypothetical protein